MDFITELIQNQANTMLKEKVTEMLGENVAKNVNVDKLIGMVAGQIGKNSETESGANGVMDALDKHTKEGINIDIEDGKNILAHIFGNKEAEVQKQIASEANISENESKDLLAMASSFVMENLGNKKAAGELNSSNLGGLSQLATSFLDTNKDGSIIDDVLRMIKNLLFKKK